MNSKEYKELSEKTLTYDFLSLAEWEQVMLHAAIGLVTEAGELALCSNSENFDTVNALEELGDMFWYLAIFEREFDTEFKKASTNHVSIREQHTSTSNLQIETSEVLDLFKKRMFYGKRLNMIQIEEKVRLIYSMCSHACTELYAMGVDGTEQVKQKNIDKLKARFGDKFTAEKALNRDLDTEREILEKL